MRSRPKASSKRGRMRAIPVRRESDCETPAKPEIRPAAKAAEEPLVALAEALGLALKRESGGDTPGRDDAPHELAAKYAALDPQARKRQFLADNVADAVARLKIVLEKAIRKP
jgi:hypothetical protein